MCPTLFQNYLRTGASTWRGLCTHTQLAEAAYRPRDRGGTSRPKIIECPYGKIHSVGKTL